ncbi:23S rRNA (uracil(1939)-C(5))-methyltransferase RlmD [Gallaecimonas sp. GXIMD4217]|uniref:23S rRNA (uracil(1939)-C(5))-methyltransferase RlmD n=1 Tax=Gallaecimonas sp. GXIMD4217 TaxID=3131927 RepID=UPI00311B314E
MARFYKPAKAKSAPKQVRLDVTALDLEGQGVARHQGRVCFVRGALPGETVLARVQDAGKKVAKGEVIKVLEASPHRIEPPCEYFGHCGGCQLQHLAGAEQLALKSQALVRELAKQGLAAETLCPPLVSAPYGYRRTLRLAIKNGLVGLRERGSHKLVPIQHCAIAEPALSELLPTLLPLVKSLKAKKSLGHLELMALPPYRVALLRITDSLPGGDIEQLRVWAADQELVLLLQHQGLEQLWPREPIQLGYELDGLELGLSGSEFIQVNAAVNEQMVAQALAWLAPSEHERILDAFCGLGNFSLPLARRCKALVGAEGVKAMTDRAGANAEANGLGNCRFVTADLDDEQALELLLREPFDAVLLDPARPGAAALCQRLASLPAGTGPGRILYVSCNPSTFVRDAALLAQGGYRLDRLGLMDMFPQTGHVETMALLRR